jgi:hypothetical protein
VCHKYAARLEGTPGRHPLIETLRARWFQFVDRQCRRLPGDRSPALVTITRTYRFALTPVSPTWTNPQRLEFVAKVIAAVEKRRPELASNVQSRHMAADLDNDCWQLTVTATGEQYLPIYRDRTVIDDLTDGLEQEVIGVRDQANAPTGSRWPHDVDRYFESTEISIDLDDSTARSLLVPDRARRRLERATEATLGRSANRPTFEHDPILVCSLAHHPPLAATLPSLSYGAITILAMLKRRLERPSVRCGRCHVPDWFLTPGGPRPLPTGVSPISCLLRCH